MTSRVLLVLRALGVENLLSLAYKSGSSGVAWQAGSCTLLKNSLYLTCKFSQQLHYAHPCYESYLPGYLGALHLKRT